MGRLRRTGSCRLYRQAALRQHSPSHRSADSFADAHHILAARTASASRRLKRLAAHQAAAARSRILLSSRNAGRGRFELFLLRRHPAHQRGHRHHRPIHRPRLGSALRSRPPPAKAHTPKNCRSRFGRNRNRSRHQPIGRTFRAALHLDTYGIIAALLASFSFAFYNVGGHRILARHDRWRVLVWTLAAASLFWLVVNPPWKIAAAHYLPAQWIFLFVFSMISVLGAFSLYFLGLQYLEPTRAIIASCLEPVFSIVLAALLLGEVLRPIQTLGIVFVLAAIVIVQKPDNSVESPVVLEPIE